ncbi:hypothetical protein RJ640_021364 [Escallonia rubra]|uniref:Dihydroflavonol 4-reductase n=1 Tax=Escallonia rubra TaxID=112253 RepID=A0AA88R5I8_9ASTE|nr:hypothetical protein RJ640_021364 [Escallonia rubra]
MFPSPWDLLFLWCSILHFISLSSENTYSHHPPPPQQKLDGKVIMPSATGQVVCVTGAGGFIASWIVKLLLERGYTVRGTVRNPDDPKNAHLRELEGAKERLTLCRADLLDYESLREAINGCDGVFHTASPVTDDPVSIFLLLSPTLIVWFDEKMDQSNYFCALRDAFSWSWVSFSRARGEVWARLCHVITQTGIASLIQDFGFLSLPWCRNETNRGDGIMFKLKEQMVEPAVIGTKNVIVAAAEAKVRRVVFTSSIGAVYMDPHRSPDAVVDESCWSDLEFCKNTKNWYCYGKAVAEQAAWEEARERGVDMVAINPVLVLGPLLQPTVNASIIHVLKYLTGSAKTYANSVQAYVHVRDVALAHILLFETPSASGRYLCAESVLHRGEVVEILAKFFPEYPIPTKCSDEIKPRAKPYKFSNQRLKDVGLEFTPVKQALYDTVKSLQEKNHIPVPTQNGEPIHIQSA